MFKKRILSLLLSLLLTFSFATNSFAKTTMAGDLDNNNSINLVDLLLLRKYLANYDVKINVNAADTDGNSKVGLSDLLKLRKYLAGWDVSLGKIVTVSFDSAGGSYVSSIKISYGTCLEEIPIPKRTFYKFDAWYTSSGVKFDSSTVIKNNTKLKAKWIKN